MEARIRPTLARAPQGGRPLGALVIERGRSLRSLIERGRSLRSLIKRGRSLRSLVVVGALAACAPAGTATGALELTLGAATLPADGVARTAVTAIVRSDPAGVVVSFSSTGGLLSSSAAVPGPDGAASVTLVADREAALFGRAQKPVTVRATVARGQGDVESATAELVFVAPTDGAPSLGVDAEPPAAVADGDSVVTLTVHGRRLDAGTHVTVTSSAGALSAGDVVLADDGAGGLAASTTLQAPPQPADALVTVREPSGVTATATVSFVAEGAAQFDLTGTFAQLSPARIRMRAATLVPNPQCVVAPAYIKVELVQTGADIDATFTTCFVTLAPVKSIAGTVTEEAPPAFVGAIPPVHAHFTLEDVALGAVFDPPASVVVSGAALADPGTDALPTSADDPRVRDSDGDGAPGVTIHNSLAGDQNITFRNTGDTRGRVESGNRIVGDSAGDLSALPESSVLGAGDAFLPDVEGVPSVWEMVRVDGQNGAPDMDDNGDGEVSCQEIVDAADFLFSLEPPSTPLDCAGVP